jgi:hypothetical protein
MSLKVNTRIPFGNADVVDIRPDPSLPEVRFAAGPHGGPESLWFCFELVETEPEREHAAKLKLTLKFLRNMLGCEDPAALKPVYKPEGQQWFRMKSGTPEGAADGQMSVSWTMPYPAPSTSIAFCYPYGRPELNSLLQKSKGFWRQDSIGMSQAGRTISRVSNTYGKAGAHQAGIYLVARQHSGETPGSWVLDGMLQQFSRAKKNSFLIWAVPFANVDGIVMGDYGKDNYPYDLNRAWGTPPMRHETLVIQNDMQEWARRCRPRLVLDLHAPGGSESDGLYTFLPPQDGVEDAHRDAVAWANVLKQGLGQEYAADTFKRIADHPSRWTTPNLAAYAAETFQIPALSLETPYASCGTLVMQAKQYREAGKRIADAILRRH